MENKQKQRSRSCAVCLYEVLLAHFAETQEDCGNLCTGCVILRVQLAVRAVDNAVGNRPLHCVYSVAAVRPPFLLLVNLHNTDCVFSFFYCVSTMKYLPSMLY